MKQFSKYLVVKSDRVSKDAYEKIKTSLNAVYKDLDKFNVCAHGRT